MVFERIGAMATCIYNQCQLYILIACNTNVDFNACFFFFVCFFFFLGGGGGVAEAIYPMNT